MFVESERTVPFLSALAFCDGKVGSSNGRILILLVSLGMIVRKPLFGYGPHASVAEHIVYDPR